MPSVRAPVSRNQYQYQYHATKSGTSTMPSTPVPVSCHQYQYQHHAAGTNIITGVMPPVSVLSYHQYQYHHTTGTSTTRGSMPPVPVLSCLQYRCRPYQCQGAAVISPLTYAAYYCTMYMPLCTAVHAILLIVLVLERIGRVRTYHTGQPWPQILLL